MMSKKQLLLFQTCGRVTLYYEVSRFDTLKLFTFFKF